MNSLNEDDFDNKYTYDDSLKSKVFDSEDGQIGMFETYGEDIKLILELVNSKKNKKRVWTMVDSDDGMYLIAGYHLINRIYYVVTKEEWSDQDESYLIQEYKEE
jgi:hypothetical protein